jgi:uncharacterized membrane protein
MEPTIRVALLLLLFAGTHVGLASGRLRAAAVARVGEVGFTALFSAVAAVAFAVLVHEYAGARFEGAPGLALGGIAPVRWLLASIVAAGVALAVAGVLVFPSSPMALFGAQAHPPRGLARVTRHPFLAGMALFGLGHALLATRLVGTVTFGGLGVFAILGAWHQDRKLERLRGQPYAAYAAATSGVPFAAIASGRQRLAWRELPLGALAIGLVAAYLLRAGHDRLLAAGGAWVIGATAAVPLVLGLDAWWRTRRVRRAGGRPVLLGRER